MADITHYFDYKSPYAYLAQDALFAAAREHNLTIDCCPYTLDIPAYLGSAEVDENGAVINESRNAHQWRRVKYAYMDCRREANRRNLSLHGPRKIFDSTIAHMGFLFAKSHGDFSAFHDTVYKRFWQRELDISDVHAIRDILTSCGFNTDEFQAYVDTRGRDELALIQHEAEARGVFGVPSYIVDEELFWGGERFALAIDTALGARE